MKLFKKILSSILGFGIIFSSCHSLRVFADKIMTKSADIPTTMDECCLMLDKICTQEQKNNIKQSAIDDWRSYLRELAVQSIGNMIRTDWLYSHKDGSRNILADFLPEHGAGFAGDDAYVMTCIILVTYHHYLLTGEISVCVEDLAIDHWYNHWLFFNKDKPETCKREYKEKLVKCMEKFKASRKKQSIGCTIM